MNFEWQEEYNLGINEIDSQHKTLVYLMDKLYRTIHKFKTKKELKTIIKNLQKYAIYHFGTEEKYFKEFNYKFAKHHIQEHEYFKKKINEFLDLYEEKDSIELSFEILDYLEDWFLDHLLNEDKKYVKCFKEKGLA